MLALVSVRFSLSSQRWLRMRMSARMAASAMLRSASRASSTCNRPKMLVSTGASACSMALGKRQTSVATFADSTSRTLGGKCPGGEAVAGRTGEENRLLLPPRATGDLMLAPIGEPTACSDSHALLTSLGMAPAMPQACRGWGIPAVPPFDAILPGIPSMTSDPELRPRDVVLLPTAFRPSAIPLPPLPRPTMPVPEVLPVAG
ncbi:hypothetical protein V8C86DRAFT_2802485 [Haematococcus lacustris]